MRPTKWIGFNPPFLTETEVLPTQTDLRLIKNDLLQLLLVSKKERVMRSDYGTPIRKAPFEPNDSETARNLRNEIVRAIELFESRVTVRDVNVQANPDDGRLTVTVWSYLKSDPTQTIFPVEAEFNRPTRFTNAGENRLGGL